jgi:hypothetical protein
MPEPNAHEYGNIPPDRGTHSVASRDQNEAVVEDNIVARF